ncbi:MAG: phosphate ABC transporter substrate-binding protein [Bacteroidetes bacterium]|nr:phosphate ABC transporter substrate-binding protein [Bacteroidota bacterium]
MISAIPTRICVFLFLLLALSAGCSGNWLTRRKNRSVISIKGSDTVLPLVQREAEVYMLQDSVPSLEVTGGGSGVGIKALLESTTDIAMSSRALSTDEKISFKAAQLDIVQQPIAYDALAVVVHPSNPVKQLTRQQIEHIYTGRITNWKEVGGSDQKIVLFSRESSSGTYEFFKEHVLDRRNFSASALCASSNGAIVQSVSQTPGAVGYTSLAHLNTSVKALAVSYSQGQPYTLPDMASPDYPISRPLYLIYVRSGAAHALPYINFVLSPRGQQLVKAEGYIPVN